jgi:hypothetical protein
MSVYDLYQSYLNQISDVNQNQTPGITDPNYLLYLQQQQGQGGGDGPSGGGLFGNLDLSNSKTFTKDVYSDELGPPGAFEFSPQEIQAYYNPTLGNYQTYEGKNINPMFSNTGATFGLSGLAMKMMGLTPETVRGFIPNSIRGYYDTPKDFFNTITGENRRVEQQKALEEAAAAKRNIQQYTGGGGDGGGRGNIGSDGADYSGSAQTGAKGGFGYGL